MKSPAASDRSCPGWGTLLEYHLGASPRQEQLHAHVSACPACREVVAGIESSLSASEPEPAEWLPETFWDSQRLSILARLPAIRRPGRVWLWPAMAASFAALCIAAVLVWPSVSRSLRSAPPAASSSTLESREDKVWNAIVDHATESPSREWVRSLTSDPELNSIREVYAPGGAL